MIFVKRTIRLCVAKQSVCFVITRLTILICWSFKPSRLTFPSEGVPMNFKSLRLVTVLGAVIGCLFISQEASAQYVQYYSPPTNYGYYQAAQPSTRYYSSRHTTNYRPAARPVTGYGANLHRNFTIKQELKRSQRTGLPVRNRGNVLWAR